MPTEPIEEKDDSSPKGLAQGILSLGEAFQDPQAREGIKQVVSERVGSPVQDEDMAAGLKTLEEATKSRKRAQDLMAQASVPEEMPLHTAIAMGLINLASVGIGAAVGGVEGAAIGSKVGLQQSNQLQNVYQAEADRRQRGKLAAASAASQEHGDILQEGAFRQQLGKTKSNRELRANEAERKLMETENRELKDERNFGRLTEKDKNDALYQAARLRLEEQKAKAGGTGDTKFGHDIYKKVSFEVTNPSSRRIGGQLKQLQLNVNKTENLLRSAGMKIKGGQVQMRDLQNADTEQLAHMFDSMDKQEVAEVSQNLLRVLNPNDAATKEAMAKIMPQSLQMDVINKIQYFANKPKASGAGDFLARTYKTLVAERDLAHEMLAHQIAGQLSSGLETWMATNDPQAKAFVKKAVNDYDLDLDKEFPDEAPAIKAWIGVKEEPKLAPKGKIPEGVPTATNPKTGEKIYWDGKEWKTP